MRTFATLSSIVLLFSCAPLCAQIEIARTVIASSGGTMAAGGVQLDQTLGEPVSTTVSAQQVLLNQGFHQNAPLRARLNLHAILEGPYKSSNGRMVDSLRSAGYLPMIEPYTALGFATVGSSGEHTSANVLATAGDNAVVDWVFVELRDAADNVQVVATRSALLQRDGDVVDVDGSTGVAFSMPLGSYYICIKHRNHLGVLTLNAVTLDAVGTPVDLSDASTATYGTDARKPVGAAQVLWAGDVNGDALLKYTGLQNDRDPILVEIGGNVPTNVVQAYSTSDVNMDGRIKYVGAENDRDIILQNIGGAVPTDTKAAQLP